MDSTGPVDPKYIRNVYKAHEKVVQDRRKDSVLQEQTIDIRNGKVLATRKFESPLEYRLTMAKRICKSLHGGF